MATKPDDDQELDLDLDDTADDDAAGREDDAGDEGDDTDPDADKSDDDEGAEEEVLTFGDDLADEKEDDSSLIRHLRAELKRARDEAKEALQAAPKPEKIEVGPEPTMADCDYDEDEFKKRWTQWNERKEAESSQQAQVTEAQRKQAEEWEAEKKRYSDGKGSLGFKDMGEAEETVIGALGENLFGALILATDAPAKVTYALAKHPEKLAHLASLKDNAVKFVAAVAKLEGQLKMVKKRKAPDPEKIERGSGSTVTGADKHLEKLEKEAERTGDRTKVIAYKKKLNAK
jgi:hypothetical protein